MIIPFHWDMWWAHWCWNEMKITNHRSSFDVGTSHKICLVVASNVVVRTFIMLMTFSLSDKIFGNGHVIVLGLSLSLVACNDDCGRCNQQLPPTPSPAHAEERTEADLPYPGLRGPEEVPERQEEAGRGQESRDYGGMSAQLPLFLPFSISLSLFLCCF